MPKPALKPIESIEDIISIFGQYDAEVARVLGVHPATIRGWKRNRKIGRENWDLITSLAAERRYAVDANLLHRLCLYSGQNGTQKRGRPPVTHQPPIEHQEALASTS